MPTPQRLPFVNGDDGAWGDIINQYLKKEHYDDGTDNAANGGHQKITIRPGTAAAGTAPLKFSSGAVMSTPEAGAIEFNNDKLYFTQTTGPTRKTIAAYDDGSGAAGDTYYRDSSGNFVRLAAGSNGQVLTLASGIPAWQSATLITASKTASYTLTASDSVVLVDATTAAVTITLPVASTVSGQIYHVKRTDSTTNTVQISRSGSNTIDGQNNSIVLALQYTTISLVSDGANWFII